MEIFRENWIKLYDLLLNLLAGFIAKMAIYYLVLAGTKLMIDTNSPAWIDSADLVVSTIVFYIFLLRGLVRTVSTSITDIMTATYDVRKHKVKKDIELKKESELLDGDPNALPGNIGDIMTKQAKSIEEFNLELEEGEVKKR